MNRILGSALISGLMAAATALGAVLSNNGELNTTALVTTAIAFILHAGKELKEGLNRKE